MTDLKYRPEIDGIRAVAVLSVALYHAEISFLSGGFVGVDIFFVVSGFLITSIIYRQAIAGTFTFSDFYWRRFRRILPAFAFMAFIVSIIGYKIMGPTLYADFGDSLWSAALFSSNIFFWTEAGYFQKAAELKPFLHTWSLGVEEQYYILIPVVILVVVKLAPRHLFASLCLIGICSFALSVWGVENKPIATFYLLPTRLWELLLGSLLAIKTPPLPSRRVVTESIQWAGFALLLAPVFLYTDRTHFPGPSAMLPCLGTAMIIWSTTGRNFLLTQLLSLRPINFVGRASYSFYLWHWPVLVLAEYYTFDNLTLVNRLLLLLAALFISWVSWRYVERPFRENLHYFSKARTLRLSVASIFAFAILGMGLSALDGIPSRYHTDLSKIAHVVQHENELITRGCFSPQRNQSVNAPLCLIGDGGTADASFVLWGDSHAMSLSPAFIASANKLGISGYLAAWAGCPPFIGIQRTDMVKQKHNCQRDRQLILNLIEGNNSIDTVVIALRWFGKINGPFFERNKDRENAQFEYNGKKVTDIESVIDVALLHTISWLHGQGMRVVLIGPVPETGISVPETLTRMAIREIEMDFRPHVIDLEKGKAKTFELLEVVSALDNVMVLYPHKELCVNARCPVVQNGYPLYVDDNHLSAYGAMRLSGLAERALTQTGLRGQSP